MEVKPGVLKSFCYFVAVQRTLNIQEIFAGKVRVNHAGLHVLVPQELLHGADVITRHSFHLSPFEHHSQTSSLLGPYGVNLGGDILLQYVFVKENQGVQGLTLGQLFLNIE